MRTIRPSRIVTTIADRPSGSPHSSRRGPVISTSNFSPPPTMLSTPLTTPSSWRARRVAMIFSGSSQSPGIGSQYSHCASGASNDLSASKSPRRNASKPSRISVLLSVRMSRVSRRGRPASSVADANNPSYSGRSETLPRDAVVRQHDVGRLGGVTSG